MLLDELVFLGLDLRIAALRFDELFGIPVADERDPHNAKPVRAHIGELGRDVDVHAIDK